MELDPLIWGPHYWFFLHTIAICYSLTPNITTKKKYYNFIQNLPLFLPNEEMAKHFSKILDNNYKPKKQVKREDFKSREKIIFITLLLVLLIIIVILILRE